MILSLVERGGEVRSFHVEASSISEVIPVVQENISREASRQGAARREGKAPYLSNDVGEDERAMTRELRSAYRKWRKDER